MFAFCSSSLLCIVLSWIIDVVQEMPAGSDVFLVIVCRCGEIAGSHKVFRADPYMTQGKHCA